MQRPPICRTNLDLHTTRLALGMVGARLCGEARTPGPVAIEVEAIYTVIDVGVVVSALQRRVMEMMSLSLSPAG